MRKIVHRHLGKVVAGAAIAVAGTAVMVGITLPGSAGADEQDGGLAAGTTAQERAALREQGGAVQPGVVERAPAQGEKGKGRDPLTDDEMKRVERIAVNRQLFNATENVEGERGPQRIGVDLAEPETAELDDPNAPRRADVTFYDYKDDTLVTKTVNLDTGKVERTGTQHDVQPPISRDEMTEAAELLIADPLGAGLKADFKDATGKELASPDQLMLNSMVYRATPGAQPAVLDACGEHRCVRLFPKVKNGPWIDSRDLVIDLSTRKVGKLG
ncbi:MULTISPECIES: Tat pathway signal sequence domain protein [unclassified Streptomyces]|uniref:Tat pathway signal sequence domain protein n=1 Tax=unclassified Streptomyces TaxID=2593676 RepID=UPI00225AD7AC|nr:MULTISPECIES: Tat pathway signal sequence domain protein [unclassified Streptomyces]MCX4987780.1 Tat pathway signal sequence domain protein [Streptomyces sp. NBC_00568]MCX5007087.1 Tat pathway signal sequence domain protein [Streptomyces sp. NBC_00638]